MSASHEKRLEKLEQAVLPPADDVPTTIIYLPDNGRGREPMPAETVHPSPGRRVIVRRLDPTPEAR